MECDNTNKIKNFLFCLLFVFILLSFICFGRILSNEIVNTIIFCGVKLIPSIFPFMVLCSIISEITKADEKVSNKKILGISKNDIVLIIISSVSGFLVGPKLFSKRYNEDITSYAILTSNAGLGFVLFYVGISLWNSLKFGIFIFLVQNIVALLLYTFTKKETLTCHQINFKKKPFFNTVTDSIISSTKVMSEICGFTIFLSAIKSIVIHAFNLEKNPIISSIVSITLEIGGGMQDAIKFKSNVLCALLTGFAIGFGGICVCFQIFSIENIDRKKFIKYKLFQGLIVGILCCIYVKIFEIDPIKLASHNEFSINYINLGISSLFICFAMLIIERNLKSFLR